MPARPKAGGGGESATCSSRERDTGSAALLLRQEAAREGRRRRTEALLVVKEEEEGDGDDRDADPHAKHEAAVRGGPGVAQHRKHDDPLQGPRAVRELLHDVARGVGRVARAARREGVREDRLERGVVDALVDAEEEHPDAEPQHRLVYEERPRHGQPCGRWRWWQWGWGGGGGGWQ